MALQVEQLAQFTSMQFKTQKQFFHNLYVVVSFFVSKKIFYYIKKIIQGSCLLHSLLFSVLWGVFNIKNSYLFIFFPQTWKGCTYVVEVVFIIIKVFQKLFYKNKFFLSEGKTILFLWARRSLMTGVKFLPGRHFLFAQ